VHLLDANKLVRMDEVQRRATDEFMRLKTFERLDVNNYLCGVRNVHGNGSPSKSETESVRNSQRACGDLLFGVGRAFPFRAPPAKSRRCRLGKVR
jgi:hypothetical protein